MFGNKLTKTINNVKDLGIKNIVIVNNKKTIYNYNTCIKYIRNNNKIINNVADKIYGSMCIKKNNFLCSDIFDNKKLLLNNYFKWCCL